MASAPLPAADAAAVPERKLEAEQHVGHFGCPRTQKMYRALIPGAAPSGRLRTAPLVTIPACPGCGDEHSVADSFGRARRPGEEVDVDLTDPTPEVPPLRTHDRGATKFPDTEVLAAIPADRPVIAADVARALGFTLTRTLLDRVERLNARAVASWGHPVVQVIRTDSGRREVRLQRNGRESTGREYHRAATRSDAEIIAAVPAEWTEATEVAASIGFTYRTFKNRIQRIRHDGVYELETRLATNRHLQVRTPAC